MRDFNIPESKLYYEIFVMKFYNQIKLDIYIPVSDMLIMSSAYSLTAHIPISDMWINSCMYTYSAGWQISLLLNLQNLSPILWAWGCLLYIFRGLTPEMAELSYLCKAKSLEMYGVDFYAVLVSCQINIRLIILSNQSNPLEQPL